MNLADLNPRTGYVLSSPIHSRVKFASFDNKRRVQLSNRQAGTEKEYERTSDYNLVIKVRDQSAALEIRDAMAHAIKLCLQARAASRQ